MLINDPLIHVLTAKELQIPHPTNLRRGQRRPKMDLSAIAALRCQLPLFTPSKASPRNAAPPGHRLHFLPFSKRNFRSLTAKGSIKAPLLRRKIIHLPSLPLKIQQSPPDLPKAEYQKGDADEERSRNSSQNSTKSDLRPRDSPIPEQLACWNHPYDAIKPTFLRPSSLLSVSKHQIPRFPVERFRIPRHTPRIPSSRQQNLPNPVSRPLTIPKSQSQKQISLDPPHYRPNLELRFKPSSNPSKSPTNLKKHNFFYTIELLSRRFLHTPSSNPIENRIPPSDERHGRHRTGREKERKRSKESRIRREERRQEQRKKSRSAF
ncbi:uncharacterized protein LOC120113042 [Phoenix dactylifera]|uniref:Uncharacterized protein LOC120113042 n=1 Tax=Phoenix dactylifera TaxID=42345 RepID=A0A8B9ART1_PHODC|nr:uncharacterized protein LOC120113042 [Phoenix dactylifera]